MAVAFDISGDMAMFRKGYTTTSSVSYPFPPPTAVAGIIGAICGLDHESSQDGSRAAYWKSISGTRIAIRVVRHGVLMRHAINFLNTKSLKDSLHVSIKHQFIRSPHYRIYVEGGMEADLLPHLENGTFIYTPYLGVSYALANISYVGHFVPEHIDENASIDIDSVIPWNDSIRIDVTASGGAFKERMPFSMNTERGLTRTVDIVYAPSSEKKLRLFERGGAHVTRCIEDTVIWFPAW